MASSISSTEAPTENGISFFTVERLMVIGATMAAQPTMSMAFIVLLPTTLPTARSGVPLMADIRLTNSSGADVPAATIVRPMIISGTFMRRASADAPSVSRSAPLSTSATPIMIYTMSKTITCIIIIGCKDTTACAVSPRYGPSGWGCVSAADTSTDIPRSPDTSMPMLPRRATPFCSRR